MPSLNILDFSRLNVQLPGHTVRAIRAHTFSSLCGTLPVSNLLPTFFSESPSIFFFFFCFFYSDSSSLNSSAFSAFNNLSAAVLYVLFFGMFSSDSKVPAALFCSHFVQNRCFSISLLDLNVPRSKSRSISSYLLFEIMVSELCRITSEEASFSS